MLSRTDHASPDRTPAAPHDPSPPLVRLVYTSRASKVPSNAEMDRLMITSRHWNKLSGLSGLLLHYQTHFIQCLEGPPEAIEATIARIARDPRHFDVVIRSRKAETRRAFGSWYMAYAPVGQKTWAMLEHVDWTETASYTITDDHQAGHLPRGFALLERVWEMYQGTLDADPGPPDD